MHPNVSKHGEYPNCLCRESREPFINSPSLTKAWFITLFGAQGGFISPKINSFSSPKSTLKFGFRPLLSSDSPFSLISSM
jgi:hypothetical protein